jgi:arylsulfatase A-like enzyme
VVSGFGPWACYRTREWNYVRPWTLERFRGTPREELYDLAADPQELTDVAGGHPETCRDMARRLEEYVRWMRPQTTGSFQRPAAPDANLSFDALPRLDAKG